MATDDELLDQLGRALMADVPTGPRPEDVDRLRRLVADHQTAPVAALPARRRILGYAAVAAVVAGAFGLGRQLNRTDRPQPVALPGVLEFQQELASTGGGQHADVIGRRVGIGRIVAIRSDDLPILPKGEFYEVWFVAANDAPDRLNRISAGTFHPDEKGLTVVSLTAAVDPAKYPTLAITAEVGDGDPRPSSREVLRGNLTVLG